MSGRVGDQMFRELRERDRAYAAQYAKDHPIITAGDRLLRSGLIRRPSRRALLGAALSFAENHRARFR